MSTPARDPRNGSNPAHERPAWRSRLVDTMRQDLACAWRGLRRHPAFALTAATTLALGIGTSTTMFSVVHSILLRPLPYPEPDRLLTLWSELRRQGVAQAASGYANIEDWRRSCRSFAGLAAYDGVTVVVEDAGDARRGGVALVSPNFFEVLGVSPRAGRSFTNAEVENLEALAVLSHDAWQRRYGSDPAALGRQLVVNGRPTRVIGVMPPGFHFPDKATELWMPESLTRAWGEARLQRGTDSWRVVARLAQGVSVSSAQKELDGIAAALERDHPATNAGIGIRLVPLSHHVAGAQVRAALFALVGAVTAVLLIACSNVASLLLARGATRQREFALREALGASRKRILGQLLLETVVLASLATAAGTGLALVALRTLRLSGPTGIARLDEVSLDGSALAFAVSLSFACAILSGLVPALRITRPGLPTALCGGGRGIAGGREMHRARDTLIVVEFALAIVLLIAAGLLGRSFVRLTAVDTGFGSGRALVVPLIVPPQRPEALIAPLAQRLIERVRALPGVRRAGITEDVLLGLANEQTVSIDGGAGAVRLPLNTDAITPDYFRAAGVPLRHGRFFTDADGPRSPPVVIINETLARRLWPAGQAVGRRIHLGDTEPAAPWAYVVGVVADLRPQGPDRAPVAQVFQPYTQRPTRGMKLVIAADADPGLLLAAVRRIVAEEDRSVPVSGISTLHEELTRSLAPREFTLGLVGAFAGIAVALAAIGIYGLVSHAVAGRTREIGVRMALGARPVDVIGMVLAGGLRLALVGIVAGGILGAIITPALSGLLFEVAPSDPVSYGGAILLLIGVALLACYLPARRAVSVDPVLALRAD